MKRFINHLMLLLFHRCSNYRGMTVPANSLLNLTKPQLHDRRSNNGNGRSRYGGTNSKYQFRSGQETVQSGQQMYHNHNTYPYYNAYSSRGSRNGPIHSTTNHVTNGSHQRQTNHNNRSRGAASNGYTSIKYGHVSNYVYRSNARGSNGNGYLPRGNGNRGVHFGGNGISQR